ncbi:MAG: DNA alkylation repair protein [Chloroflexota bacterium]
MSTAVADRPLAPMTSAMTSAMASATTSATTLRSRAFVAARVDEATALGRRAGDEAQDPAGVAALIRDGLPAFADPEYLAGQRRVAPGIGHLLGVRNPLLAAVTRGLRAATRRDRPDSLLDIAEHLDRDPLLELHWIANDLIDRAITREPERAWQLVRGEARAAADWITVDNLAHVAGRGILAEPYRWAELEQLVYSPSRWERRLAGSTVATMPFVDRAAGRTPEIARRGLGIVGDLVGDAEPDVQRSLSWALRNLLAVDHDATIALLDREAAIAVATVDGHRARVIRDTFEKLDAPTVVRLRTALGDIRKKPGAPGTSRASAAAADFLHLGLAVPPVERTVINRS